MGIARATLGRRDAAGRWQGRAIACRMDAERVLCKPETAGDARVRSCARLRCREDQPMPFLVQYASILVTVIELAVFLRAIMSWFPTDQDNLLVRIWNQITEPILAPLRDRAARRDGRSDADGGDPCPVRHSAGSRAPRLDLCHRAAAARTLLRAPSPINGCLSSTTLPILGAGGAVGMSWTAAAAGGSVGIAGLLLPEGHRGTGVASQAKASAAVTAEDLRERASALGPVLRQRAAQTEQLRQIPSETIADLIASGLIRIGVPRRFGGLDVDYELMLGIGWELGRACGATAWCYSLWATHAWLIGHWPAAAQEEVFGGGPNVLASSSFFPGDATIEPAGGGFRLSGRWQFSSGCDPAGWLLLGVPGETVRPGFCSRVRTARSSIPGLSQGCAGPEARTSSSVTPSFPRIAFWTVRSWQAVTTQTAGSCTARPATGCRCDACSDGMW